MKQYLIKVYSDNKVIDKFNIGPNWPSVNDEFFGVITSNQVCHRCGYNWDRYEIVEYQNKT